MAINTEQPVVNQTTVHNTPTIDATYDFQLLESDASQVSALNTDTVMVFLNHPRLAKYKPYGLN